jgi:ComF family protein
MKRTLIDLWRLLFPLNCHLCGFPLEPGEEDICMECSYTLPILDRFESKDDHTIIRITDEQTARAVSYLKYRTGNDAQKLIHLLKYRGNRKLAYNMGKKMAISAYIPDDYRSADMLVPVPLHPNRLKERGYNQSEELCLGISSQWNIPVRTDVIRRVINTKAQAQKQYDERVSNMKGAFALGSASDLAGKHIIIVDDVLTTGSTILSCGSCLLSIPDVKFSVFTLATTQKEKVSMSDITGESEMDKAG